MQNNLDALIEATRHLSDDEREQLLRALLQESKDSHPSHRITELRGLGKALWNEVDAQDYVNAERDSWDN